MDIFDKRYATLTPDEINVDNIMRIQREIIDTLSLQKIPLRMSEHFNYFFDALERNRCPIHPKDFQAAQTVLIFTDKVPSDDGYLDEINRLKSEGKIPRDDN